MIAGEYVPGVGELFDCIGVIAVDFALSALRIPSPQKIKAAIPIPSTA